MTLKKSYNIGDTVWIHGIARSNKLTQGNVIHSFTLDGFTEVQYVISVPTAIEPLLEVREWGTISQDSNGPVGTLREMVSVQEMDAANKKMSHAGYEYDPSVQAETEILDAAEPTSDEIHAALERSQKAMEHAPLMIKENKPRSNKRYPRKKKV